MTPIDLAIRAATYRLFAELGRAPNPEEVAASTRRRLEVVIGSWRRLHDAHALVLAEPDAGGDRNGTVPRIVMANPFSAVETPHQVVVAGRTWFANCGWDAFGIGVVLRSDSAIRTTCPDCDEAIDIEVRGYRPVDPEPVFHVLVPARDWWADIGFT